MIRAVVDTNILIRALIKPQGSVGSVIAALRAHSFELVLSRPLLEELMATIALLIVTSDEDLLVLDPFEGIRIISAGSFLRGLGSAATRDAEG